MAEQLIAGHDVQVHDHNWDFPIAESRTHSAEVWAKCGDSFVDHFGLDAELQKVRLISDCMLCLSLPWTLGASVALRRSAAFVVSGCG